MSENNSVSEIKKLLVEAINNNYKVLIRYFSSKGEVTERVIGSINYTDEFDKFGYYGEHIRGYCYLRNDERHFKIERILSIKIVDDSYCNNWINNKQEHIVQQNFLYRNEISGNNKSQKNCFIASYVFGFDASETLVLRAWRDDFLAKSEFGRCFIKYYYKFSPLLVFVARRCCFVDMIMRKIVNITVRYVLSRI